MAQNAEGISNPEVDPRTEEDGGLQSALKLVEAQIAEREDTWRSLLAARDDELKKLWRARDALRDLLGVGEVTTQSEPAPPGRKDGGTSNKVREIARKAMEEEGRPLNRVEILARLETAGVTIPAVNPGKFIGKVMWRSREFKHVGEGYWLAGKPLPHAPSQ